MKVVAVATTNPLDLFAMPTGRSRVLRRSAWAIASFVLRFERHRFDKSDILARGLIVIRLRAFQSVFDTFRRILQRFPETLNRAPGILKGSGNLGGLVVAAQRSQLRSQIVGSGSPFC